MPRTRLAGKRLLLLSLFCLLLLACSPPPKPSTPASRLPVPIPLFDRDVPAAALTPVAPLATLAASQPQLQPVIIRSNPLAPAAQRCSGAFLARDLEHITSLPGSRVEQFEANGAGLALGDLDDDGDLDVVLANHAGSNTILWNEGSLNFRAEPMDYGDSRAVNLLDVDADGWLDIVFTRRSGAVNFLRNYGQIASTARWDERFRQQVLPGISRPAYAMAWGDLDDDGDLDLVTGSYDASLLSDLGNDFLLGSRAGVFVYENRDGRFRGRQLADTAQAMTITLFDIDGDGRRDIVVGNDFAVPDYAWLRSAPAANGQSGPARDEGWTATSFDATTFSTMSLDAGDVDNDGRPELFATDMAPYAKDPATTAAWQPLMDDMDDDLKPGDPQIMSNVLQVPAGTAGYQNAARPRGVSATGWSWSAKFGDLDQDGLLDLYVVNGMAEARLLGHLPNGELVEENQALRNIGDGYFRPVPAWGLGSTRGGRGMSMGDLDGDGDLDIVVNNLAAPAQLFENRLCSGASLQVDLRWPDSPNSRAIGAVVELETSAGRLTRDVRSGSGYLSGDPPRLHFGFPVDADLLALTIRWPDGAKSVVERPQAGARLAVTRQP